MTLLIHDANVLIDLIGIDLLDLALDLPFSMATTDLVRREIEDPKQARALGVCIKKRKIAVIASTILEMSAISDCMNTLPSLSLADSSVLYHAAETKGIVITGDGRLRKAAAARHIAVYGTP
jgi:rRNA-processing protein FCF1